MEDGQLELDKTSPISFVSQIHFWVAIVVATYYALQLERATEDCFLPYHEIAPESVLKQYHVVEHQLVTLAAQCASTKPLKTKNVACLYNKP